jgi:uncharacterized protein YecT (DUF1311 family)
MPVEAHQLCQFRCNSTFQLLTGVLLEISQQSFGEYVMTNMTALCLLVGGLAAWMQPINIAYADSGYSNFKPTEAQLDRTTTTAHKTCLGQSHGITVEMNNCMDAEFVRMDRRLNASYQATLRSLSSAKSQRLRTDQRSWLATRQEICLNELKDVADAGGSRYSILSRSCNLRELRRRILWIENGHY